jgi:hypothetical protein
MGPIENSLRMLKLVCFVYLVHLVCLVQLNKRDKPNNGLFLLADFFSILLEAPTLAPNHDAGEKHGGR